MRRLVIATVLGAALATPAFAADADEQSPALNISAATVAETLIVLAGRSGDDNAQEVLAFLDGVGARIVPVDRRQALLVNEAFLAYGKGRHKARLNYGDCFAYALAKSLDLPLLFKGDDFRHTDVRPAV